MVKYNDVLVQEDVMDNVEAAGLDLDDLVEMIGEVVEIHLLECMNPTPFTLKEIKDYTIPLFME